MYLTANAAVPVAYSVAVRDALEAMDITADAYGGLIRLTRMVAPYFAHGYSPIVAADALADALC